MDEFPSVRILLVDDHPLVLQGIRAQVQAADDPLEVVATAQDGDQALRVADTEAIDVAVVDLSLPDMSGFDLIEGLLARQPGLGIVVLTMHDEEDYVLRAVSLGARSYVLKEQTAADLIAAIRAVHAGHSFFSPRVTGYLLERVAGRPRRFGATQLTGRESQVLRHIADGMSNRETAERLHLSVRTVQTYRERLMKKLDLHTVADLTRFAVAEGLVDLPATTRRG